jgi:hypothetical protein
MKMLNSIKKNWKLLVLIFVVFHFVAFFAVYIVWPFTINHKKEEVKKMYTSLKNNERIYCYIINDGYLSPAYFVNDSLSSIELLNYYKQVENGKNPPIVFKIQMLLTLGEPLILLGYNKDSSIVEFVDINTRCWGYEKGYLYINSVHKSLPNDSLILDYENRSKIMYGKSKDNFHSSRYGSQCD